MPVRERNPVERRAQWLAQHYPRTVVADVLTAWAEAVGAHPYGQMLWMRNWGTLSSRKGGLLSLEELLGSLDYELSQRPSERTTIFERYLPWVAKILNERHKAAVRRIREAARTGEIDAKFANIRDLGDAVYLLVHADLTPYETAVVTGQVRPNYLSLVDAMRFQFGTVARWADATRTDLGPLTFDEATVLAEEWINKQKFATEKPPGIVVYEWPDEWTVRELLWQEDLEYEGAVMGHCVDTYDAHDVGRSLRLFSLRDPENAPHATMEWMLGDSPYSGNYVSQLRGKGNQSPPKLEYLVRMAEFRDQYLPTPELVDLSSQVPRSDARWLSSEFGGRFLVPGDPHGPFELWAGHSLLDIGEIDESIADYLSREKAKAGKKWPKKIDAAVVLDRFWPDDLLTVEWPPPMYEWWLARRGPDKGIASGEDELAKALTEGENRQMRPVFEALHRRPLGHVVALR